MSNVQTKLKKNYLALAIAIAVLGVISLLGSYTSSYANDDCWTNDFAYSETNSQIHVTGKAVDPDGNALVGASIRFGYDQDPILGYTDSQGNFDIEVSPTSEQGYYLNEVYIVKKSETSPRIEYRKYYRSFITSDMELGTIKCPYFFYIWLTTNGVDISQMADYGTWYMNDKPLQESNGGGFGAFYYYNAFYTIDNNKIIINTDETSCSEATQAVYEYKANQPHVFYNFTVDQTFDDPWPSNNSTGIYASKIYIDAVVDNPGPVPPTPTLHTITFGENISKVLANGVEIDSGTEVEEGANLQIIPAVAVEKVTKVYVNDSVCPACQTTVNSDIDIEGQMFDSVKLSGKVVTGEEEQPDAYKAVSKLFINKAYAAGAGVEGAMVTFTDATDGWYVSTVSDSNGEFELCVVQGNAGMLTVSKDGYETYTKEIDGVDLEDDYVINPILKSVNTNPENNISTNSSTQTGDSMQLLALLFIIAISCSCVLLSKNIFKVKGKHIK